MINKTVIINRAVPGSGKTTITNCIVRELLKNNLSVSVHSTDEYFMDGEKYLFELEKLGEYHNKNYEDFKKSILAQTDVVICDNTNIAPWQTEPYTNLAREYNYNIIFITLNPRELQQHIESQKVTPEKPDAHGVHEDILKMMINEYFIYDDLLNKNIVINKQKHMHYKWNNELSKKIEIDIEKYFDSDYVIRILPDEYKLIQSSIGYSIFELINRDIKTKTCLTDLKKHSIIESSLESAIIYNDIDNIKCFLNEGVILTNKCSNGLSLLKFLFFKNNYKIIKEFYKFFPNEIKEYILTNPLNNLLLTTYLEDLNLIDKLLKDGLDINQKGEKGNTPLHVAVDSNNIKLVEYFIQKKADLNTENNYNDIPLVNGLKNQNKDIVQYLISQHKKINSLNDSTLYKIYQIINTETQVEFLNIILREMNIDVNKEVHYRFFKKLFIENLSDINRSIIISFLNNGLNLSNKLFEDITILEHAKQNIEKYLWFINYIKERTN
jgi:ankyrin repeat protein/predicted kinase